MNWYSKAQLFRLLSGMPWGEKVYRLMQKYITKSIIATPERVGQKMDVADRYLYWLLNNGYSPEAIREMRHIDFGAGWHPTIPIYLRMLGVQQQVLLDLFPVLTLQSFRDADSLVRDALTKGKRDFPPTAETNKWPYHAYSDLRTALQTYGLDYQAPYEEWATQTDFQADFVTSSQVLLHISQPILDHCFRIIHRLLKNNGLFMVEVHLFDIYANSDPNISKFNHLKYSTEFWNKKVNSRMMSFNRFKSRDYCEALERCGFEIITFDIKHANEQELKVFQQIEIHPEFHKRYSLEELSETLLTFVARKK